MEKHKHKWKHIDGMIEGLVEWCKKCGALRVEAQAAPDAPSKWIYIHPEQNKKRSTK